MDLHGHPTWKTPLFLSLQVYKLYVVSGTVASIQRQDVNLRPDKRSCEQKRQMIRKKTHKGLKKMPNLVRLTLILKTF